MKKVVFLSPLEGMVHLAHDELNEAFRREGYETCSLPLRRVMEVPLDDVVDEVTREQPDLLVVQGGLGFNWPEFFLDERITRIPVAALWFDDPYRPFGLFVEKPAYLEALQRDGVTHFVWDGHWRTWLKEVHGVMSYPIHLAAFEDRYFPQPERTESIESAVFVGALISPKLLLARQEKASPVVRKVMRMLERATAESKFGTSPYEILEETLAGLPSALVSALEAAFRDPDERLQLRSYAWSLGKNEVRRRMLREAARVLPVLVFSGNLDRTGTTASELRAMVGETPYPIDFRDSSDVRMEELRDLYRYGVIHLQATDPQSVEGGIPFRVFQTTACGRPLLSDRKLELAQCYRFEEELLTYGGVEELPQVLSGLVGRKSTLRDVAEAGLERFKKEHQWSYRVREIIGRLRKISVDLC